MPANHYWYKDAVFYEVYIRAFRDSNADGQGDIPGLIEKLDYLKELGVDCLWLLPMYPSPLTDDGYDISDFYSIHPDYGTLQDFQLLINEAHARGLRVITDLVLNHTSDLHPWFQAARSDRNSPYHGYYVWSDRDDRYAQARVIFGDSKPSNWTWDEVAGRYYWHRFYASQPDLNFDNLAVQEEMLRIADFWLAMGIDGFRADAVPYLFEREGTSCENLPETHAFLKKLRRHMDERYRERLLLLEANQQPEDVLSYFASGDEAQMAFHFPLMPRVFMALKKGEKQDLVRIIDRTPPIPPSCQWCTFLRNHDELTLEMVTEEERQWMWEQYAPNPRMLVNLGIRRRLAPLLDNNRKKIELANALLFALPGSPTIYYGDELGMGDNIWLPDRNGVRTPMQWTSERGAGFSDGSLERNYAPLVDSDEYAPIQVNVADQLANPQSLFHFMRRLIAVRRGSKPLGRGEFGWAVLTEDNSALLAFWQRYGDEQVLALYNLSDQSQLARVPLPPDSSQQLHDLWLDESLVFETGQLEISLPPYGWRWLRLD